MVMSLGSRSLGRITAHSRVAYLTQSAAVNRLPAAVLRRRRARTRCRWDTHGSAPDRHARNLTKVGLPAGTRDAVTGASFDPARGPRTAVAPRSSDAARGPSR